MTPVAAWFVYSLVVGVLVSLSAWLAEAALRVAGRPGRWAWAAAMLATVVLPLAAVLGTTEWARSVPAAPAVVIPLAPLATAVESAGPGLTVDRWLVIFWAAVAIAFGLYLLWTHRQLVRGAGRQARVEGVGVYVTEHLGPAVFGLCRARILVPRWALGLETRLRRFMLLHEGEHARAGDGQLVLAALLLTAAVPWNLPLWFQLKRLRSAIELDCDARVLRRVPDRLGYGGLLLEVGRRRSGLLLGVAMAERRTLLEERLRRISAAAFRPNVRRSIWLGAVATVVLAVAMCTRDPLAREAPISAVEEASQDTALVAGNLSVTLPPTEAEAIEAGAQDRSGIEKEPIFTPFTQAPRIKNRPEMVRSLEANYPPLLRSAGIGGAVRVWFLIDKDGAVVKVQVNESSGYPGLDEAAVRVAQEMEFTPAFNRAEPVMVWVEIPIVFTAKSIAEPDRVERFTLPEPATSQGRSKIEERPVFTPFTQAPRLTNRDETMRALERAYPPLLRDAGIGGMTYMWFLIDEEGMVVKTQVGRTSTYPALDEAAEHVARQMRFTPARNREKPVLVWVEIPIRFSVK